LTTGEFELQGVKILSKILTSAVVAGVLMVAAAPIVAYAADAPKDKASCEKVTGMKWDATTKTCVKK
jgi:ABC-type Fe2+-enterobactin transport system substrate-binding protein